MTTPTSVLTIGNFDGVHLGHQALLDLARSIARPRALSVKVLTFDPHPVSILRPGHEPPRIMSLEQRIAGLKAGGADEVVVIRPTREFLSVGAREFVGQLVGDHQPGAIVEGGDFNFGKDRKGTIGVLSDLGREMGFEVRTLPDVEIGLLDQIILPVRSTVIRNLIANGRVADAALCLGRFYAVDASVVQGEQRGRRINVPTANLDMDALQGRILPPDGVYAGTAMLPDRRTFACAISIGVKPTFGKSVRTLEAHLLDFQGDLYGQTLRLSFARWVRDQQAFPTLPDLVRQLGRDIGLTRSWHEIGILLTAPVPSYLRRTA